MLEKFLDGVPNGIRTRVAALKGRCPRPLDDGDWNVLWSYTCFLYALQYIFLEEYAF